MQYIQGSRKGKEAHRLEKEAMKDPFLSEALDGYQSVEGNHVESIEEMRRRISRRTRSRRRQHNEMEHCRQSVDLCRFRQLLLAEPSTGDTCTITVGSSDGGRGSFVGTGTGRTVCRCSRYGSTGSRLILRMMTWPVADRRPRPVVGEEAYQEYLKKELIHPQDSLCKDVSGTVIVEFHINEQGRPVDLAVKQSLCESVDKEAIRLIEKGPDWEVDTMMVSMPVVFVP